MDQLQSCFQHGLLNTHLSCLCLQVSLLTSPPEQRDNGKETAAKCARVQKTVPIMPSNFHLLLTLLHGSGILFLDINTHFVFSKLVWPVSRHQSVSACQTLRDRTTTGPVSRPWSEHAGEEKKWYFIVREPWTAECTPHWRNRSKMPQGTKREKQLGEQEEATRSSAAVQTFKQMIIYYHLYFKLCHYRNDLYPMILLTVMQRSWHFCRFPCNDWPMNLKCVFLKFKNPF